MSEGIEPPAFEVFQDVPPDNLLAPMPTSPSTPPLLDDFEDSDMKLSRKREREVSLEPLTPQTGPLDIDTMTRDIKERRTPKKNRVQLDATVEEDDAPSRPQSPPLSASPPHEMKVRQISQGVEDIHWQNNTNAPVEPPREQATQYTQEDDTQESMYYPSSPAHSVHTQPDEAEEPPASFISIVPTEMDIRHDELTNMQNRRPAAAEEHPASSESSSDLSDSVLSERGLKRKSEDPTASPAPLDTVCPAAAPEPLKRARDDADTDDNPRETKRPSPPPEKELNPTTPSAPASPRPKLGGFMAYASQTSPFAAVKGQSIFSKNTKETAVLPVASPSPSPSSSSLLPAFGASPFSPTTPKDKPTSQPAASTVKRTGFEAFSGSASPFAALGRPKPASSSATSPWNANKSPVRRVNPANLTAFSSYASGKAQPFAIPASKRARAGSPNGGSSERSLERTKTPSDTGGENPDNPDEDDEEEPREATFGERLRASGDDLEERSDEERGKLALTEQEIATGEEEEETVRQVRGKLFSLSPDNQWKERGTGSLKLNVRILDGGGARLVMRKEAVYTVILNITLFRGMRCFLSSDPRYIRFSAIEDGRTTHYNLRVATAKVAEDLLEDINSNIPL